MNKVKGLEEREGGGGKWSGEKKRRCRQHESDDVKCI